MMEVFLEEKDIWEICRYAGFGTSLPDRESLLSIKECMDKINSAARPAYVYREFEHCEFLTGNDIKEHLNNCHKTVLMAATIGSAVDELIRKAAIRDVALSLYMDACASTLIELVCDRAEADIRELKEKEGDFLTGRFSPGYGDLPIDCQSQFVGILNATRRIGLTVSDSGVLIPLKSVTAVMGVSSQKKVSHPKNCDKCSLKNECYMSSERLCSNGSEELT